MATRVSTHSGRSRDERRRRTRQAILAAARTLFSADGYERTTIRGVATQAHVDPAPVMHHYGSKEGLFAVATHWEPSQGRQVSAADVTGLPAAALDDLLDLMEGVGGEAATAALRSCLTHPPAAQVIRDDVMSTLSGAIAPLIDGDDAALRAELFTALVLGLVISRYLLELAPVAHASHQDLHRVSEPMLRTVLGAAHAVTEARSDAR